MHANIGSLSLTGQLGTTIRCSGLWDGRPVATTHSEDSELRAKKDVRTRCCGYILTGILSTTLYRCYIFAGIYPIHHHSSTKKKS